MKESYILISAGILIAAAIYAAVCRFVKNSADMSRARNELEELDETLKNDADDGEHFRAIDHYKEEVVDPDLSCVVGEKIKVN